MYTCYLCAVGGKSFNSAVGRPATTEGFGTCVECAVHACAVHGDLPITKNEFRCADCWSNQIVLTSLRLRTRPAGGPSGGGSGGSSGGNSGAGGRPQAGPSDEQAQIATLIARYGFSALLAIAPALGALGFQHAGVQGDRMAQSCEWLRHVLINGERDALRPLEELVSGGLEDESVARRVLLGWEPLANDAPAPPQFPAGYIGRMRLTMAFDLLLSGAPYDSDAPMVPDPGMIGGLAVQMAYAARGSESIAEGILAVPGALLLRPLTLALGIAYWAEAHL
jgi:hypothetical protein